MPKPAEQPDDDLARMLELKQNIDVMEADLQAALWDIETSVSGIPRSEEILTQLKAVKEMINA